MYLIAQFSKILLPEFPALAVDGGELLELLAHGLPVDVPLHQVHQLEGVVEAQVAERPDRPLSIRIEEFTLDSTVETEY